MQALAPANGEYSARVFKFGHFSPWLVSLPGKYGKPGLLLSWALNFFAIAQPLVHEGRQHADREGREGRPVEDAVRARHQKRK